MSNRFEPKIEAFIFKNGIKLKVTPGYCDECYFKNKDECPDLECSGLSRSDKTEVCFVEEECPTVKN